MPESTSYRPDIDGLRALAVLLVVGYHASPERVPGGFIGVDVFFVISGYLITGIILRELEQGSFSFLQFYARRCRRIVPALAVALAAVWAIGWRTLLATEYDELGQDIVAGATFTTNLTLWHQAGYFAAAATAKPLLHLWSLAVEEQFYLAWPLLLFFATKRKVSRKMPPLAIVAVLGAMSFLINVAGIEHHAVPTFYLLPSRFWELMIGAALAVAVVSVGDRSRLGHRVILEIAAASAVAAIVVAAFVFDAGIAYPGWWALVPTLATAALIVAGEDTWLTRVLLSNPAVVLVGLISYPLYLWHWPLLAFARIAEEGPVVRNVRIAVLVSSLVLSWLTWRFVERPVRGLLPNRAVRTRTAGFLAASLVALVIVGAAGWKTHTSGGFIARYPILDLLSVDLSRRGYSFQRGGSQKCSGRYASGNDLTWCETSKTGEPEAALLGDSHADHLFGGIAAGARENWLLIAQSACPPLQHVRVPQWGSKDSCTARNLLAVGLVNSALRIKTVVVALHGPAYVRDVSRSSGVRDALSFEAAPSMPSMSRSGLFEYGLSAELGALESEGRDVVLFLDVPELSFPPTDCVETRPFRLTPKPFRERCAMSKADVLAAQARYRDIVSRIAHEHARVHVFDPLPLLCDDRWCDVARNGQMLYRDRQHLSASGSREVAAGFLQWLTALRQTESAPAKAE